MTFNAFALVIWMHSSSYTVPAIPVRVGTYNTEAACEKAAEVWRAIESHPTRATRSAACIPVQGP